MSDENGIIILKREPGPAAGTKAVTIDAPGFNQAVFIVNSDLEDTIEEKVILRKMMAVRAAALDASRTDQI